MKYSKPTLRFLSLKTASARCVGGSNAQSVISCDNGPDNVWGACAIGNGANDECKPGTAAGGVCDNGTSFGDNCYAGGTP